MCKCNEHVQLESVLDARKNKHLEQLRWTCALRVNVKLTKNVIDHKPWIVVSFVYVQTALLKKT